MVESPLEGFRVIKQGAEGRLHSGTYLGKKTIIKERFNKKYRHPALDQTLTKERIKAEARSILRCKIAGIHVPTIYLVDLERNCIFMEEIANSVTVKDYINGILTADRSEESTIKLDVLTSEIGKCIAKMHEENIIHGDLTTSNMLVVPESGEEVGKLYFIDFGLSHVANVPEDKGVDLYVLERAITSTHTNSDVLFKNIIENYMACYKNGSKDVMKKLEEVRARGRKRTMVG